MSRYLSEQYVVFNFSNSSSTPVLQIPHFIGHYNVYPLLALLYRMFFLSLFYTCKTVGFLIDNKNNFHLRRRLFVHFNIKVAHADVEPVAFDVFLKMFFF